MKVPKSHHVRWMDRVEHVMALWVLDLAIKSSLDGMLRYALQEGPKVGSLHWIDFVLYAALYSCAM